MKQKMILQILLVLLAIHNIMYMPLQTSILTLLGAFALYGLTGELLVPVFILFISPLIVLSVKMYKKSCEGFQVKDATSISERVVNLDKAPREKLNAPTGVMEMSWLENFEDVNATTEKEGAPAVSVPAFVKEKGRLLVVPESHVSNLGSVDTNPKAQHALITGEDPASVNTALAHEATELGNAAQPASARGTSVGPSLSP